MDSPSISAAASPRRISIDGVTAAPPKKLPAPKAPPLPPKRALSEHREQIEKVAAARRPTHSPELALVTKPPKAPRTRLKKLRRPSIKYFTTHPIWSIAQYPIVAGLSIAGAYSALAGQALIVLYAIYALTKHLDSSLSFSLGLCLLVCIPLFQFLGLMTVSQHVAIYTFELVIFGALQVVLDAVRRRRELRELNARKRPR